MKAKFTYENLDFERGKDIRKTLGDWPTWIKEFDSTFFTLGLDGEREEFKKKLKDLLLSLKWKEIPYSSSNKKLWGVLGDRDENRAFQLDYGVIITTDQCLDAAEAIISINGRNKDLGDTSSTSTWREALKALMKKIRPLVKTKRFCRDDWDMWKDKYPDRYDYPKEKANENINFERGGDPKKSIRVGLSEAISNGLKALRKDPLIRDPLHVYKVHSSDRGRDSSFPDESNYYMEVSAQEIPTRELMWEILTTYLYKEYFYDIWEDNQLFHIWRIFIKNEYAKYFIPKAITERLEFERGMDPKSAMDMGMAKVFDSKIRELLIYDGEDDIKVNSINFYDGDGVEFVMDDLDSSLEDGENFEETAAKQLIEQFGLDEFININHEDSGDFKGGVVSIVLPIYDKFKGLIQGRIYMYDPNNGEIKILPASTDKQAIIESLEFERGIDPKKAIGLGKKKFKDRFEAGEYMIANLDRITDASYPNYEWEDIEYDTADFYNANYDVIDDLYYGWWEIIGEDNPEWWTHESWGLTQLTQALQNAVLGKKEEASKIKESFDFERGKDPKVLIGIGKEHLKQEIFRGLMNLNDFAGVLGIKTGMDKNGNLRLLVKYVGDVWRSGQKYWENTINQHIGKFVKFDLGNPDSEWFSFKILPQYVDIFEEIFPRKTNESLDFKRGQDPKESMDIGIMKVIESLIDEFAEKHFWRKNDTDRNHGYLEWYKGNRNSIKLRWNLEEKKPLLFLEVLDLKKSMETGREDILKFIKVNGLETWFFSEVYESLEFERGQDPETALGVGIKGNMDKYFQKYDDIVEEIQKTRAIGQQHNFVDEIMPLIPKRIYQKFGWGNIHYAFKDMNLKEYLPIRKVVDKYYNLLFESINFKRGQDPIKSIGIGLKDSAKWIGKADEILKPMGFAFISANSDEIMKNLKTYKFGQSQYNYGLKKLDRDRFNSDSYKALWEKPGSNVFVILDKNDYYNTWGFRVINSGVDIHPTGGSKNVERKSGEKNKDGEKISWREDLIRVVQSHLGIHESINFERGQDPKTSMRVGIRSRVQEFIDFIMEEMSWNDPHIQFIPEHNNFTYDCLPGASVIQDLKIAIEKFGWKNIIKVNKDPDDWASRSYDDGASRHYYVLSFKRNLRESLDFERGQDPKESIGIGVKRIERNFDSRKEAAQWIFDNINGLFPNFDLSIEHADKNFGEHFSKEEEDELRKYIQRKIKIQGKKYNELEYNTPNLNRFKWSVRTIIQYIEELADGYEMGSSSNR